MDTVVDKKFESNYESTSQFLAVHVVRQCEQDLAFATQALVERQEVEPWEKDLQEQRRSGDPHDILSHETS